MCNGSWVHIGSLKQLVWRIWPIIIILQISMSIATMEEEIVGVTLRLNQAGHESNFKTSSFIALNFQRSR